MKKENIIGKTLLAGGYTSFGLLVAAIVIALTVDEGVGLTVGKVGLLILMATPILRILAALLGYVAERNRRMAMIAVLLLVIIGVATSLGMSLS